MLKPVSDIPAVATVHCLMDDQTRSCSAETVYAFFDQETADLIMQIPIAQEGGDFVRWPHTKAGIYSVRSAYNLARSDSFFLAQSKSGGGTSSATTNEEKRWKAIWKIIAPGKMKIHLWRFAHDCLPTGIQLIRRHVPASSACVFCGREESIEHAMLHCQFAQEVWRGVKSNYSIQLQRRDFISPKSWLFQFLNRATDLDATVLAVTCWFIWEARNNTRNDHPMPNPNQVSTKIVAYVEMIILHCFKAKPSIRRESKDLAKWTPPPPGFMIVNVDAALFPDLNRMSMGAIFRDHRGSCVISMSEPLQGFSTPEMAEAMAVRRALKVAADHGFPRVIVASDCLSLVQRLCSSQEDRSLVGSVVTDVKRMVVHFDKAIFRHVMRSLNEAAHILARTCDVSSLGFISSSTPNSIMKTLCIDVI
jgi:ribonuclease HI